MYNGIGFYRGVPPQWIPAARVACGTSDGVTRCFVYYPKIGSTANPVMWAGTPLARHYDANNAGLTSARPTGFPTLHCVSQSSGGGIVGAVRSTLSFYISAVSELVPPHYRKFAPAIISLVVAAWTSGALAGLLESAMPTLNVVIAKKIASKLVGKVITPKMIQQSVVVPDVKPASPPAQMFGTLMAPIKAMAAHSSSGDPVDGLGTLLATGVASSQSGKTAQIRATGEQLVHSATLAVAQLQTNVAVLLTLIFTNELRTSVAYGSLCQLTGWANGWTPDQWFGWLESLPVKIPMQPYSAPLVLAPFTTAQARAIIKAQGAPTARRDALRAYVVGAGLPAKFADWVQGWIEASPAAFAKARAGGTIVQVTMQAISDAVHAAATKHAQPFTPAPLPAPAASPTMSAIAPIIKQHVATETAATPPAAAAPRPAVFTRAAAVSSEHKLAPVLFGATLFLKALASGVI